MNNNQSKIWKINHELRDIFHASAIKKTRIYLRKDSGDWNQFFSAIETIDDTCLAIDGFQKNKNHLFEKNPYLVIYGLLQALFIQQDAVKFLKISLFGKENKINWEDKKYSELFKIRQLRNETIGHPTKTVKARSGSKYENDKITYCTIDRSSLNKDGFKYILWMHSGTEYKTIKFEDIINEQDKHLGDELKIIMEKIIQEEKEHREKFKGQKLSGSLNNSPFYDINLIRFARSDKYLGWPSFDYHYEKYQKVKKDIESRYENLDENENTSGTVEVIKDLDFIFQKISTFKKTDDFKDEELDIYVGALINKIDELEIHLKEIDQQLES